MFNPEFFLLNLSETDRIMISEGYYIPDVFHHISVVDDFGTDWVRVQLPGSWLTHFCASISTFGMFEEKYYFNNGPGRDAFETVELQIV